MAKLLGEIAREVPGLPFWIEQGLGRCFSFNSLNHRLFGRLQSFESQSLSQESEKDDGDYFD
jgi:hypothetical protein